MEEKDWNDLFACVFIFRFICKCLFVYTDVCGPVCGGVYVLPANVIMSCICWMTIIFLIEMALAKIGPVCFYEGLI